MNTPKKSREDMIFSEEKAEEVHRNPWFYIMNRNSYYTLEYDQPQVVVLPIVNDTNVLLIKSIRPIINDTPWELPAGGANVDESITQTARRELAEETGIMISDLERFKQLPSISEMPGRMPQLLKIFTINLTKEEFESRGVFDNAEVTGVEIFPLLEIVEMIRDNIIYLSPVSCILSRYIFSEFTLAKL